MPRETQNMLNFTIDKSVEEIIGAAAKKMTSLEGKIEERQERLAKLREQHKIDDAALVQLLTAARRQSQQMSYSYTSNAKLASGEDRIEERTIGAGVVNHLLTESDHIEAEREAVKKLRLIVRNLRPLFRWSENGTPYRQSHFELTQEELEYLGF